MVDQQSGSVLSAIVALDRAAGLDQLTSGRGFVFQASNLVATLTHDPNTADRPF
ncbi:hypothetical protein [Mycobacterium neglectum]|uniref:hypothetical protein n=1 Tax=Mycobacterium neglectum TaxID=242737 RepID=UPI00159BA9F5|nr:hypothetical protein [Mycobacterium neglectum]